MLQVYQYLIYSGLLTLFLWTPYIAARALNWGIPLFLHNYPEDYPKKAPEQALWVDRAHRAHLNMVETMPALIAVIAGAGFASAAGAQLDISTIATWAAVFFYARIVHALVYIFGTPYLRTPSYLVSWAAIIVMGITVLKGI